jgi:hypothetical protein
MKSWIGCLIVVMTVLLANRAPALPGDGAQLTGAAPAPVIDRSPVFVPVPPQIASAGNLFKLTLMATDPDGGRVQLVASSLPSGATFIGNPNGTGTFDWAPTASQIGNYSIEFHAAATGAAKADGILEVTINVDDGMIRPSALAPIGDRVAPIRELARVPNRN